VSSPTTEREHDAEKNRWFYSGPSNFEYDDLNRVTMLKTETTPGSYARSHYQYDTVGREAPSGGRGRSKGDRFSYSTDNQLTGARYKASGRGRASLATLSGAWITLTLWTCSTARV